ncbi:MAG: hypothetical protein FJX72_13565 [Armatimonadetes bacterium]|nr:hypothetical protein [Armatimonadota bacterium]
MRTTAAIGAALLGTCLPYAAPAQATQATDAPAVTLARVQKVGDVWRARVIGTANVSGAEVTLDRTIRQEVKEIKKTGEVVTITRDLGGKVNAGGQEMEVPESGPVTVTSDKLGRMVKYEKSSNDMSIMAPEVEQIMAVMQDYLLPEKPVKAGDTWENALPNPLDKDKKLQVKTTFVGMDKVEDAQVWKIKQVVTAVVDSEGGKMTAEIVFLAHPTNGATKVLEGTMKGMPTQYGPIDLKLKVTQLKPEAEKAPAPPK